MNTSVNNPAPAANNIIMSSFIDANYIAGRLSVGIYHLAERITTDTVNFTNAANALNYAFLLKKRHGINIAARAFDLIMWEIKRTGAISTRAQRKTEAAKAAPAAAQPEQSTPTEKTNRPRSQSPNAPQSPLKHRC